MVSVSRDKSSGPVCLVLLLVGCHVDEEFAVGVVHRTLGERETSETSETPKTKLAPSGRPIYQERHPVRQTTSETKLDRSQVRYQVRHQVRH